MLLVDGVSIGVGGVDVVGGLDLEVGDHEVVGLIGPGGAGKSTVLDAITGARRPTAGRVLLDDQDLTRLAPHRVAGLGVARTFQAQGLHEVHGIQAALFPGLSVRENIDLGRKVKVRSSVLAAARCWRAAQREDARQRQVVGGVLQLLELEDMAATPVGALPCGLRRRVELARALALEPRLLLLDDLTSGLTISEKDDVLGQLRRVHRELGLAIVFASRDIGVTTELCDRVVALHRGRKIAEGPAAVIRQDHRVMSAYLAGDDLVRD